MAALVAASACKTTMPVAPVVAPVAPTVTVEQKIGWLLRLEQARSLRDLGLQPVAVDAALPRATQFKPAGAPALDALAMDPDATMRRRAVLAIGRIGAPEGIPVLVAGLQDPDPDVRGMAAFGLGLMGADAKNSVAPLLNALADE